MRTPKVTE